MTRRQFKRKSVRAFTLIELLVVIAIIGILMSMIIPGISKARASSKTAVCLSNVKSMGTVNTFYVNDHDGYFVAENSIWLKHLKPYGDNRLVILCPEAVTSSNSTQGSHKLSWESNNGDYTSSYGYNAWAIDYRDRDNEPDKNKYFYQIARVDKPSETPIIFDCTKHEASPSVGESKNVDVLYKDMDGTGNGSGLAKVFLNRHYTKKINCVRVDGSAVVVPITQLYQMEWNKEWIKTPHL
ncbi:MAG: type II secretion system protein [Lentisphaeraceae bacterium]|nr:type II secretion system protein [Lentisphaeraceae bacterium]